MPFIRADAMIPLQWRYYSIYKIKPFKDFLEEFGLGHLAQTSSDFHASYCADFPKTTDEEWAEILSMDIIYPAPEGNCRFYNAWSETKKTKSFREFSYLWYLGAPSDDQLINWSARYGLPCVFAHSNSFESASGFTALHTPALKYREVAKHLWPYGNLELKDNPGALDRFCFSMFKVILVALAREAHDASVMFESLRKSKSSQDLDIQMREIIKVQPPLQLEHKTSASRPIKNPKTWTYLQGLISSRLKGLQVSMKTCSAGSAPYVKLSHAFSAEDLLTTMWVRFYDDLLSLEQFASCPCCDTLFEKKRSNQIYCCTSCQNKANQRRFRAKATLLNSDIVDGNKSSSD